MDLLSAFESNGGVDAVSRELGVDRQTASAGIGALLPSVLEGIRGQAAGGAPAGAPAAGGIGGLLSMLGSLGGGGLLSNVLGSEPTDVSQGNTVLGQIFGSKDTSRAVADDASQKSGLSPDLLKKMLPIVAMLAVGYLATHGRGSQPAAAGEPAEEHDGSLLGGLLKGEIGGGGLLGTTVGGGGILGSILGGLKRD
jgi:hypothetical protein